MVKQNDYAVLILTHGRADNILTTDTLHKCGYNGEIYYIIDDEDEQMDQYKANFGDHVIVFNKKEAEAKFDVMDNFHDYRAVVYARNMAHEIAKGLGLKHFIEMDDDYNSFSFRYIDGDKLAQKPIKDLDAYFKAMFEFLDASGALTVAMAQGGDFIGGINNNYLAGLTRKAMNVFFCKTDRPFQFYGEINEDTTSYVNNAMWGNLMFTSFKAMVNQLETQSNKGGLTDIYLAQGTYVKSFYTVMAQPSAVKVAVMGDGHYRLHHRVDWNATAPKILSEEYKR